MDALMDALQLVIASIPIAITVALGVQGLKVFGFVDGESAPRAAIGIALGFGGLSILGQVYPPSLPVIEMGFVTFNGAMVAGLFYEYIAAPVLANFSGNVSAEDLS